DVVLTHMSLQFVPSAHPASPEASIAPPSGEETPPSVEMPPSVGPGDGRPRVSISEIGVRPHALIPNSTRKRRRREATDLPMVDESSFPREPMRRHGSPKHRMFCVFAVAKAITRKERNLFLARRQSQELASAKPKGGRAARIVSESVARRHRRPRAAIQLAHVS